MRSTGIRSDRFFLIDTYFRRAIISCGLDLMNWQNDRPSQLCLFVYGTLKRGYNNHQRFCQGVLTVEEATVCGRLYHLPVGYPRLVVPRKSILAHGTTDVRADVALQNEWSVRWKEWPDDVGGAVSADWDLVCGEILTFDDPEMRLPALDQLEGFDLYGTSLYQRVLLPVQSTVTSSDVIVWTYVGEPEGKYLPNGCWPE